MKKILLCIMVMFSVGYLLARGGGGGHGGGHGGHGGGWHGGGHGGRGWRGGYGPGFGAGVGVGFLGAELASGGYGDEYDDYDYYPEEEYYEE